MTNTSSMIMISYPLGSGHVSANAAATTGTSFKQFKPIGLGWQPPALNIKNSVSGSLPGPVGNGAVAPGVIRQSSLKGGFGSASSSNLLISLSDVAFHAKTFHPKQDGFTLRYGTAGFRTKGDLLDSCMFRMGLLATLRSKQLGGRATGIMITASHNPACDNGVKIVDPTGDMLVERYEQHATKLANALNDDSEVISMESDGNAVTVENKLDSLQTVLTQIIEAEKIDLRTPANVFVGRDTRESSVPLSVSVIEGIAQLRGTVMFGGLCTTPHLHYMVKCYNDPSYGKPTLSGYVEKLSAAWNQFCDLTPGMNKQAPPTKLSVDCANGVGYIAAKMFKDKLNGLDLQLINTGSDKTKDILNLDCGADFVKTKAKVAANTDPNDSNRHASYDGDADRLIYYYVAPGPSGDISNDGKFTLLDGDRIATLFAKFIGIQLSQCGLSEKFNDGIGLVQTNYANGASIDYGVRMLGKKGPILAKTGVKHCHHKAKDMDVGIYFEANGHGTIVFSRKLVEALQQVVSISKSRLPSIPGVTVSSTKFLASSTNSGSTVNSVPSITNLGISNSGPQPKAYSNALLNQNSDPTKSQSQELNQSASATVKTPTVPAVSPSRDGSEPDPRIAYQAAQRLLAFRDLINECVGDALSDMLAVEAVLRYLKWSESDWVSEYVDLPNRLTKVEVPDRFLVETDGDNEALCVKPLGLQKAIDECCEKVKASSGYGRSFVRPSGTEDVIRVYAEAGTEEDADKLLNLVSGLVKDYCSMAE